MYVCLYTYTYICIYIYRERERDRYRIKYDLCVYIYIYTYVRSVHEHETVTHQSQASQFVHELCTNIMSRSRTVHERHIGRPILYTTNTQKGWCIVAFLSSAAVAVSKSHFQEVVVCRISLFPRSCPSEHIICIINMIMMCLINSISRCLLS